MIDGVPNLVITAITTSKIFKPCLRTAFLVGFLLLPLSLSAGTNAGRVSGKILDPRGAPVAGVHLKLLNSTAAVIREAKSDEQGSFILRDIDPGEYQLTAQEPTFVSVILDVSVARGQQKQVTLQFRQLASVSQAITIVASAPSLLTPDPAQSIVIHDQVLDANPGRPGAPISIPGFPIENRIGGNFLANRFRTSRLALGRQLLASGGSTEQEVRTRDLLSESSSLWHCPRCGAAMIVMQRFTAAELSPCSYFDSS
jgi:hypothetical protein